MHYNLKDGIPQKDYALEDKEMFSETLSDDEFNELVNQGIKSFSATIDHYTEANKAIFSIFFNYFNILAHEMRNDLKSSSKKIIVRGFLDNDFRYNSNLPTHPSATFKWGINFEIDGIDIMMILHAYNDGATIRNIVRFSSSQLTEMRGVDLYQLVFNEAINVSNLKGSYLVLQDGFLSWEINELKKLSFDDVFLPKPLMTDLSIYVKLFESKGILSRYMFNGPPGSGKTEITRAISKILNNDGVTIIKTNVCEIIKEKFDLATILAPSLVILDDLDLYLGDRNHGSVSQSLGKFLDILDGVDKLPSNVGVIATTNAPHLIDLAAQRPGRFNKLLFFDELTKENIKDIILKSLNLMNLEYNNVTKNDENLLTDNKLIDFFKSENSTGAFIFETIKNIKYNIDILGGDLDLDELINEIGKNNKILSEKLKANKIKSNYDNNSQKMGY